MRVLGECQTQQTEECGAAVDIGTKIREYQHVVKVGANYRFGAY